MAIRDAGWIMLFAENNQEAVWQHLLAFKIAEKMALPVMVNVDGFILTHCYEPVYIPDKKIIKKFLPLYKPAKGSFLDSKNPLTMGAFMTPEHYQETRKKMAADFVSATSEIKKEYQLLQKIMGLKTGKNIIDNGLLEYTGPKNPKKIVIALGSVIGTIKSALAGHKNVGVLKIKSCRPFPEKEIYDIIKGAKEIIVLEKAISPGNYSPLFIDIKAIASDRQKITSFVSGLGGRDITEEEIKKVIK
jgi:pyruvate ferredoxin oxidoreductase alpha subunit